MGCRYLAVGDTTVGLRTVESSCARLGLTRRMKIGALTIFASIDTPLLELTCGGIAIGSIFSSEGAHVSEVAPPCGSSDQSSIRKFILQRCWGEYVLVQPEPSCAQGFRITRSPAPSGDIPCIYFARGTGIFITSDASLLTKLGLYRHEVDWETICHCLSYPHLHSDRTALRGIRELLPGSTLRVGRGGPEIDQEWSPWDFVSTDSRHDDIAEASSLVQRAVSMAVSTMAASDQSVLLELSGGLDSSIVGTCLRGAGANVVCATLVPEVPGADEKDYASSVARRLDAPFHVVHLPLDSVEFDFPVPGHSTTPRLGILQQAIGRAMEAVAAQYNLNAFFTGGGGDTVFSYLKTAAPAADAIRELGFRSGQGAIRELAHMHRCTLWTARKLTLKKLLGLNASQSTPDLSFLTKDSITGCPRTHPWLAAPHRSYQGDVERISGLAASQMFRENSIRTSDRRLRMPLLSQPVVEACLRTPSWMWISGGRDRAVARRAFSDALPAKVLDRRSKGSFLGFMGALYARNKTMLSEFLLDGMLRHEGLLDPASLQRYFSADGPPRDRSFTRILDLCAVENWLRNRS